MSLCGNGRLVLLNAFTETGVQPHPAPESNQSDSGIRRLLKPAIIHTQCYKDDDDTNHLLILPWLLFEMLTALRIQLSSFR